MDVRLKMAVLVGNVRRTHIVFFFIIMITYLFLFLDKICKEDMCYNIFTVMFCGTFIYCDDDDDDDDDDDPVSYQPQHCLNSWIV